MLFCNHDVLLGVMTYFIDVMTYFWCHILFGTFHFNPNSLKNLDPGLFCCFRKATYCTCVSVFTFTRLKIKMTDWDIFGISSKGGSRGGSDFTQKGGSTEPPEPPLYTPMPYSQISHLYIYIYIDLLLHSTLQSDITFIYIYIDVDLLLHSTLQSDITYIYIHRSSPP